MIDLWHENLEALLVCDGLFIDFDFMPAFFLNVGSSCGLGIGVRKVLVVGNVWDVPCQRPSGGV